MLTLKGDWATEEDLQNKLHGEGPIQSRTSLVPYCCQCNGLSCKAL